MGSDRVVLALQRGGATASPPHLAVYVIPAVGAANPIAVQVARDLRTGGWSVVVDAGERSLKARMRQAQKSGAGTVVIIGENELASGRLTLRDMAAGEQTEVTREELGVEVDRILNATARAQGGEA
jgi:histidyl-tRNA synthetase